MPPVGFEPTISAGERPQTYALDRAAAGIGVGSYILTRIRLVFTDVSRQPIGSIFDFLFLEDGTDKLSLNVGK